MNPKIFIAFALGVLVASGVAYYAAKPQPTGPVAAATTTPAPQPEPVVAAPSSAPTPEPAPVAPPPPIDPPKRSSKAISKPAPIPARSAPVQTASKTPAPTPAPSTPEPAPVPVPVNQPLIVQDPPPPPPASTPYHAPKSEPAAPVKVPDPPPPPPKANTVTIPAGTLLNVRLQEKLSSEKNQAGDTFSGTLDQPVVVDGFVIADRGARVQGRISELDRAGRVKGLARLVLELTQVNTTDGQRIRVQTSPFERKAESTTKKDAAKVGIGAAIGAAIGAIAGGGKGAATGAGVGGAAGAGQVLLTRGEAAELNVESRLAFRLQEAVTVTEKLNN